MKIIPPLMAILLASCLARASADDVQSLDGKVLAFRSSYMNAKIVGNVSQILVEEGQAVERGDVLLTLDDSVEAANYELARVQADDTTALQSAQALRDKTRKDLERTRGLVEKGTIRETELETAEYYHKLAQIQVDSAQKELDRLNKLVALRQAVRDQYTVCAPFSGIIAAKLIELGESSHPTDKRLFLLIDISKVYVEVHTDISLLSEITVGQGVAVTTELYPEKTFPGTVSFISPSADPASATFGFKVLVDNPESLLHPFLTASVSLKSPPDAALEESVQ